MTNTSVTLQTEIAQKIMIDLRYYSEQITVDNDSRTPLTKLPKDIANLISESNLGGVILFADNLQSHEQTITLNHELQQAAAASSLASPLLISIDQEGGRVFRSPRHNTIAFTGNMAIGATYKTHGTHYATQSARVIGEELKALGFNVNHAPTIDVNANPENPVINVRAFGEDPEIVANLGQAQVEAFQQQGIVGTIKHFPGHGDTATDSHTGLPRVDHDLETVMKMDIAPFKQIIDHHAPGMIMTAHIQYPALDNSTFVAKNGTHMIKPATMSRAMITDLLRDELGYNGVVVTDAMDMAGISNFFEAHDGVINTFKAGVDIALMPIKIRTPKDLDAVNQLINSVVAAVESGELDRNEIHASFLRIQKLKTDYQLEKQFGKDLQHELAQAPWRLNLPENRLIEQKLAQDSITLVAQHKKVLPLKAGQNIHLIMPDTAKCVALESALHKQLDKLNITYTSAQRFDKALSLAQIEAADIVIGAHIAPRQSAAEMGGMDDLAGNSQKLTELAGPETIEALLTQAKQKNKAVVFVSLRTPYEIKEFSKVADTCLATYAYNIHTDEETGELISPALSALAKVLSGKLTANGHLPVTI